MPVVEGSDGSEEGNAWISPVMQGMENSVLVATLLGSEPPSPTVPLALDNNRYVPPTPTR
jgi:hypothetical protein